MVITDYAKSSIKQKNSTLQEKMLIIKIICNTTIKNQSGAAEAWWAHNPQVPGSKPGSDKKEKASGVIFFKLSYLHFSLIYFKSIIVFPLISKE